MKKILSFILTLALIGALAACGAPSNDSEDAMLFTDEEIGQVNENNTEGYINGEKADADMVKDMEAAFGGGSVAGLPDGFPQSVPFYEGAELLEADTYGDNGFTVIYMVGASYESVVAFYMQAIPSMDESGIGEDEAYFEGMDLADGVHINGLTISDADGTTQVFITLDAGSGDITAYDDALYNDDSYDDDADGYSDTIQADYDSVTGEKLEDGYPKDVIPLYEAFKIIDTSKTPDNDLYILDGIAPPDSYDDVMAFYSSVLGVSPESFDSQIMKTDDFSGEQDGWSYSVYIAEMKAGGNVSFHISVQK